MSTQLGCMTKLVKLSLSGNNIKVMNRLGKAPSTADKQFPRWGCSANSLILPLESASAEQVMRRFVRLSNSKGGKRLVLRVVIGS